MTAEDEPVLSRREGAVLTLTFNRPRRKNAPDEPAWSGLSRALREAREDDGVRALVSVAVVILRGRVPRNVHNELSCAECL